MVNMRASPLPFPEIDRDAESLFMFSDVAGRYHPMPRCFIRTRCSLQCYNAIHAQPKYLLFRPNASYLCELSHFCHAIFSVGCNIDVT